MGDGKADLIVGAPTENGTGRAYWYGFMFDPGMPLAGESIGDGFGFSVLVTRDVTGDRMPDVLVGAPWNSRPPRLNQGTVFVYEDSPSWTCDELRGSIDFGEYGKTLAEVGDVHKNREIDITAGQPDPIGTTGGAASIHAVLR